MELFNQIFKYLNTSMLCLGIDKSLHFRDEIFEK